MKKLLTILGALGLGVSATSTIIACGEGNYGIIPDPSDQEVVDNILDAIEQLELPDYDESQSLSDVVKDIKKRPPIIYTDRAVESINLGEPDRRLSIDDQSIILTIIFRSVTVDKLVSISVGENDVINAQNEMLANIKANINNIKLGDYTAGVNTYGDVLEDIKSSDELKKIAGFDPTTITLPNGIDYDDLLEEGETSFKVAIVISELISGTSDDIPSFVVLENPDDGNDSTTDPDTTPPLT